MGLSFGGKKRWNGCFRCREQKEKLQEVQAREKRKQSQREAAKHQLAQRFRGVGIPLRFQSRTFENYQPETDAQKKAWTMAVAFAENFEIVRKHGACLVLCGSPGTGKTHLAAAVANRLYIKHLVLFRGVLAAVRHVKNTWNRNSELNEAEAIADLVKPDLLILDDVGVQFGSEAEK